MPHRHSAPATELLAFLIAIHLSGRLGGMSRRKSEITGHIERDFPHLVVQNIPLKGRTHFRDSSQILRAANTVSKPLEDG
jgi:hypothetical protein